jgi:hypothetical protein
MTSIAGVLAVLTISAAASANVPQELTDFMPVGVRYRSAADAKTRHADLQEMQRLHFNVVLLSAAGSESDALCFIDRMLAGAPFPRVPDSNRHTPARIPVMHDRAETNLRAWSAIAHGAREVVFDDWTRLRRYPGTLTAAAEFAETITRNAPLYASLRPRKPTGASPDVQMADGGTDIEVNVLESPAAFLIVGLNRSSVARTVTMTFSSDLPEAIWQNMMTGNTLSFVTGGGGPTYTRTFAPKEVLVLMINRRLR